MESKVVFECVLAHAEAAGYKIEHRENPHGLEARLSAPDGEATVRYYSQTDRLDIQAGPAGRDLKPSVDRQAQELRGTFRDWLNQALAMIGPDAFAFLEPQDRAFALSSLAILETIPILPDYSAVVLPMAKCSEGYAVKLLVKLGLADQAAVQRPEWNFGQVWDSPQYQALIQADKNDKKHLERIRTEIPFTRHASMHSRPGVSSWIGSREIARAKIGEIANLIRESFDHFKARV